MRLTACLASLVLPLVANAGTAHHPAPVEPPAPPLTFLYTSYVHCLNSIYESQGPRGIRTTIPIIGGNFTGPRLSGKILDVGADWGVTDPQTGIFSADTRYNFQTNDGANIFIQTSGPAQPNGNLQLRALFETGDKDYYWLNNVVALGTLANLGADESGRGFWLRIDVWHLTSENAQGTKFVNGSTYPAL